jgi:AraC-like DNA-binding protein
MNPLLILIVAVTSGFATMVVVVQMLHFDVKHRRLLLAMILLPVVLDMSLTVFSGIGIKRISLASYTMLALCLAPLVYVGITALVKKRLNNRRTRPVVNVLVTQPIREKYGNNRLPVFLRESIVTSLTEYMTYEQPWSQPELTLSELASALDVNSHHLSQIINSEFGKSFACYVNEYRVQSACQRLANEKNSASILDIAMESGFSSKSSFNAAFKKFTGLTPSEFRRERRLVAKQDQEQELESLSYGS